LEDNINYHAIEFLSITVDSFQKILIV